MLNMRLASFFVLLVSGCVMAQVQSGETEAVRKVALSLEALKDARSDDPSHRPRITEDIMSISEDQHRPPQYLVQMFAAELVSAVGGKQMSNSVASQLASGIVEVMHSAGVSTYKFRQSILRVEIALRSLQVNALIAKRVSAQLAEVGKQVRGPEDLPVLPL
jgi:hypothetical protein